MALQLRRGTDAERQAMTPLEGELIYVVDYDSVGTSPLWIGDGATAGGLNALAPLNIAANTATNLAGGATGSIPYQTASSSTSFIPIGAVGSILASDGTTATWQTLASLSSGAGVNADNVFVNTPTAGDRYIVLADDNGTYIAVEADKGAAAPVYNIQSGLKVRSTLTIGGNIIPDTDGIYNIGAPNARFATLYLTTATIDLGGESLTAFDNVLYLNNIEIISTSTIGNYQSSTATNLAGGTAGQIAYQTGPGLTSFAGPGTAGQLLVSAGASAPVYTNTSSIYVNRAVTADGLTGGSSVNGNLTVTGNLVVQGTTVTVDSTVTNVSDPIFTIGTGPNNADVASDDNKDRGIAFKWNDGTNSKTGFFGFDDSTGYFTFFSSATFTNEVASPDGGTTRGAVDVNLAGGTAGQLVYQSGADTTAFVGPGTAGQILVSAGASAPTYTNTGSIYVGNAAVANILNSGNTSTQQVGFAATAGQLLSANTSSQQVGYSANLLAGSAGSIPYQSGANATTYLSIGTNGYVLSSNGSAPTWTALSGLSAGQATTATNLAGGTAGQIPYQSSSGNTGFIGPGSYGQFLMSAGAAAPVYQSTLTLSGSNILITSNTSATSTSTGALQVVNGGAGIGGNVYVGGVVNSSQGIYNSGMLTTAYKVNDPATAALKGTGYLSTVSSVSALSVSDISVTPNGRFLYSANLGDNTLGAYTINTTTGVLTNIAYYASANTRSVVVHPNGKLVYNATNGPSIIPYTINQATGALTAGTTMSQSNLGLSAQPYGMVIHPSGRFLYAANGSTNCVSQYSINQSTGALTTLTSVISVGSNATAIAMDPTGRFVYVKNQGDGTISQLAIDQTTGYLSTVTTALSRSWTDMTFDPSGRYAFVNSSSDIYTYSIDQTTGALTQVFSLYMGVSTSSRFVADPLGRYLFGTVATLGVYSTITLEINQRDGSLRITGMSTPLASDPSGIAIDPTGRFVFYGTNFSENVIKVFAINNFSAGQAVISAAIDATNTQSGALQVVGGLGVGKAIYAGGNITAPAFIGALTGTATTATNLAGGTAGQLAYQTAAGATSFAGPGTAGQILVSAGASAPTYTNTGSIYVGNAATANVLNSGNTSTQQVGFADTAGALLAGNTGTTYVGFANKSNNVIGGTAGQLLYNSAADTTGFVGPGTVGQILVSAGTSAPTYTNTGSIYVGNAATANVLNAGNTATQQVGYAANVLAGAAGSLVYQSGANATAMLGISSTNGAILVSNGSTAPQYATWTTAFTTGTGSTSVATNQSLRVTGGGIGVVGDSFFKNNVGIDGTLNVTGAVTFSSPVTFNGTATYVLSTNTWYTDNILELHVPPGGVNTQWQADDGKDIGFRFHYYTASTDTNAALVLANDTKYLEWYGSGAEGTSTFVGSTYGTFKTGNLVLTGTAGTTNATSGAIQVAGGVGVGGNLYVAGIITATTFVGAMSGTATSANNITGGTAGQLVYQTGAGATSFAGPGTTGQILVSAGTSAPTYTNTGSIYVGNAATANVLNAGNTATQQVGFAATAGAILAGNTGTTYVGFANKTNNVIGGTAGQLLYNSAADTTGFVGPGTAGNILVSNGTSAPTYNNTLTLTGTTNATSTQTGAFQVRGGAGIGLDLYVGGTLSVGGSTGGTITGLSGLTSTNIVVSGTTPTSSTVTGALQVVGGMGVGGGGFFGGIVTATTFVGALTGTASAATNIAGGTAGQLVYQTGAGATSFAGPGTAGQILVSAGTSAPTYTNTGSIYVGNAATANILNAGNTATQQVGYAANVLAGAAGSLHYQTGANATGMLAVGTAGQILTVNSGATAPQWSTTSTLQVGYSANLLAGAAGSVPYQSGANATTQLSIGAANTILVSTGSAPSWVSTSSIYATKAANADKVDTVIATGNAVHYVTFVDSNNVTAATEINYTTSTFVVNPATGNVAIGTTSTTNKFQISGAYGQLFSVVDSFTGTVFAASDISGIPSIEVLDTGFVKIAQYGGTVAISTASTVTSSGSTMGLTVWTSTYLLSLGVGSTASGVVGEIRASNEITAYYSSDRRLKENVRLITDPITLVNQLNGVYFDWTDEHIERRGGEDGFFVRKDDVGVIAQEVEAVLPQLVADRPDGFKGVKYEKMIPLLIEAIKQQDKTINRLEEELREIKTRLSNLE